MKYSWDSMSQSRTIVFHCLWAAIIGDYSDPLTFYRYELVTTVALIFFNTFNWAAKRCVLQHDGAPPCYSREVCLWLPEIYLTWNLLELIISGMYENKFICQYSLYKRRTVAWNSAVCKWNTENFRNLLSFYEILLHMSQNFLWTWRLFQAALVKVKVKKRWSYPP